MSKIITQAWLDEPPTHRKELSLRTPTPNERYILANISYEPNKKSHTHVRNEAQLGYRDGGAKTWESTELREVREGRDGE